MTIQEKADALFEEQKVNWPLMKSNWDKLVDVRLKQFDFDGFSIRIQCNPRRIVSSAAKVDRASIKNRRTYTSGRIMRSSAIHFPYSKNILQ